MPPSSHPTMDPEEKKQYAMVDLLQVIVNLLKSSTIVEEKAKDVRPKFWAEYKKVSGEFDDTMIDWCNGNLDTMLIFAGLFSGINTAFIMAMQPNPLDTTNALLVLLIQISLNGPSAAQSASLSSSTNYPPIFWMQALAYMSLALSLLAAFGAVMGKQWLNFYKVRRYGVGSLEEQCKQRHDKFQGLETWWFEGMLQTFSDLLKASLFLFGVSLAGWMWTLQRTISILIISMTAFGFTSYGVAILLSVICPNCPFQTRLSLIIRTCLYRKPPPKESFIVPAMDWMLKTSTYPDSVRAVLDLLSDMPSLKSYAGVKSLFKNVLHMFEECFSKEDTPILKDAQAYGTALIKFSRKYPETINMLDDPPRWWGFWEKWHIVYLSVAVEECQTSYEKMKRNRDDPSHEEKICTAMQMVVPNDVGWIWGATFKPKRDQNKADMFKAITSHFIKAEDFNAAGDAFVLFSGFKGHDHSPQDLIRFLKSGKLLHVALRSARALAAFDNPAITFDSNFRTTVLMAICSTKGKDKQFTVNELLDLPEWPKGSHLAGSPLSDIQRMLLHVFRPSPGNPAEYIPYCRRLVCYLRSNKSKHSKLKPVAIHRARKLGQHLATIDAERVNLPIRNMVVSEFFPALLEVAHANSSDRNDYLRLIFAFASSRSWLPLLHKDSLIQWCNNISLELQKLDSKPLNPYSFYPAGILVGIHPEHAALRDIKSDRLWNIMKMAWHAASCDNEALVLTDVIKNFGALVTWTEKHMSFDKNELESFLEYLGNARTKEQLRDHLQTDKQAKDEVDRLELEARHRLWPQPQGEV